MTTATLTVPAHTCPESFAACPAGTADGGDHR